MMRLFAAARTTAEAVAAAIMAAIFLTFILQVTIRYTARIEWIADVVPLLEPTRYGWTLELCLALWVWLIFFGNAFVVRDQDHVSFDLLYNAVSPQARRIFVIVGGLIVAVGLIASVGPTWDRFYILRLKKTATLSDLLGSGVRMRDIYSIYIVFLIAVAARYIVIAGSAVRGAPPPTHLPEGSAGR